MKEVTSYKIFLLAPRLLGESLAFQLESISPEFNIEHSSEELQGKADIIIWCIDNLVSQDIAELEIKKLKQRWHPTPILIVLPHDFKFAFRDLIKVHCEGIVQDPSIEILKSTIQTIIKGGKVYKINDDQTQQILKKEQVIGLGKWLLLSGIQQIDSDINLINKVLQDNQNNPLYILLMSGRKRELIAARKFLNAIWGTNDIIANKETDSKYFTKVNQTKTDIVLIDKSSLSIFNVIQNNLQNSIDPNINISNEVLLPIMALDKKSKINLFESLIEQLRELVYKLDDSVKKDRNPLLIKEEWEQIQPELRRQAIRKMIGNYEKINFKGDLLLVSEKLFELLDLSYTEEVFSDCDKYLIPLLYNKPIIIDGKQTSIDEPQAIIQLELFFSDWLIRSAELISSELISASSEWPELRTFLLNTKYISTREIERLRNRINSISQFQNLIKLPIQIYESKRTLYSLKTGTVEPIVITETRDEELKKLSWIQRQVALAVETRDALAPQLKSLIKYIGDLMVILLTKVIGRSIGLIGRGIAQGMGRNLSKG